MRIDVISYAPTCSICQSPNLITKQKRVSSLPLGVLVQKWALVAMELIIDVVKSNRFFALVVFHKRTNENGPFPPCLKGTTTRKYAKMFVSIVLRLQGVLEALNSNKDPRFSRNFKTYYLISLGLTFGLLKPSI